MGSTASPFNDARIRNHDDKVLLARITEYFEAFANADADKMDSMVADDYRMSDISKRHVPSPFHIFSNTIFTQALVLSDHPKRHGTSRTRALAVS